MKKNEILLVEDSADQVELVSLALEEDFGAGTITVARDGVEALDYLLGRGAFDGRDTSVQPRLVVLDLKLPRLSGLEVLERMRNDPRTACVPVVVLTSSSETTDIDSSYRGGANSFVRKSVDFGELTRTLRQIRDYWLSVNVALPHV